jgi:hypothetical protein
MRSISHAVPGALAALLRAAPLSPGKVDFAWNAAVGATVQRATRVRLEGDVLIVDVVSTQWGREVSRSSRLIVNRLDALLGAGVVRRLQIRTRPGSDPVNQAEPPR